jgi:Superinfection immunity protein
VHVLFSIVIVFVLGDMALAGAALYLLPVLIGWARRVPDLGSVAVINVLLGWTLVGWAAALAMALRSPHPGPPPVQVVQHFPQPQPWPGQQARPGWSGRPGPPPPRPGVPPPLTLPPRPQASPDTTTSGERQ